MHALLTQLGQYSLLGYRDIPGANEDGFRRFVLPFTRQREYVVPISRYQNVLQLNLTRAITFLASGLVLLAVSIPALAADAEYEIAEVRKITGVWASKELGFELEIYGCGASRLCGRVISYSKSSDYVDVPTSALQEGAAEDQRIVGRELLSGFVADQEDSTKWNDGRIFNPKDGRTYRSTITLADEDTLRVRAYVGLPFFGRNLTLKRIQEYSPAGGV